MNRTKNDQETIETLPKFLEGEEIPEGYFDAPDSYKSVKSLKIDIGKLADYARKSGKDGWSLTREEIEMFKHE